MTSRAAPRRRKSCGTEPALDTWPGQHLGLAVDAREHLFALFDRNKWRVVAEAAGYHQAEPPGLIGRKVSGFERLIDALQESQTACVNQKRIEPEGWQTR